MPDAEYEAKWGKGPHLTVDAVVFWEDRVLLIQRKDNGQWAIPGGFVNPGERLAAAAIRELIEETSIKIEGYVQLDMTDVFIRDDPARDPRSHIISVVHVFYTEGSGSVTVKAGDDAQQVGWFTIEQVAQMDLYADHTGTVQQAYQLVYDPR